MRFPRAIAVALSVSLLSIPIVLRAAEEPAKDPYKGLELRNIGPAFMSGRVADIAIDPRDQSTWYVAVGSGGVWKTTNAATTWEPIFDGQGSYSVGCVTIDPSNPSTIWVGSGENVSGRHVGYGDGVYRSLDGGKIWKNMGLAKSEHIGNIVVHPENSNVIFVAAQGPLWSSGGDRGVYRSTDGGATWKKILGAGEYTGANEVHMDPRDPNVLYAALHQRFRNVAVLIDGGPESGIYKSTDGGDTWREINSGLAKGDKGKIGLAISPQDPDVVYAAVELPHRKGAFYRSSNGGESWEKMSDTVAGGTGPHYYTEIFASPHAFDRVYFMDVRLKVTEDGGKTFQDIQTEFAHVDNHAMAFDPDDPDYLLVGCDGGVYESWDLGAKWRFVTNLPTLQYYKVAVDYDEPFYNLYGGTQDNNTHGGPSRTDNVHGIRNADWFITIGGDGHQPAVDYSNPDIVYSESQQGHLRRWDRTTGESIHIQPHPRDGEPDERYNWDAPILISPHDPATLFYASYRLWRSDDRGDIWTPVSGDLTRSIDRLRQPVMGRIWSFDATWDLYAMSRYSTITSISQSPIDADLLYVGTDDGLIQVSEDGGDTWRRIERLPGVPQNFFVNDIKADLHDANTVYVAIDDHKSGDFSPYLLKSTNRGRSWRSIAANLPERHLVWRVVQDHVKPELLFAGTEFGVFFSIDGGAKWTKLTGGVPNIPFRDLAIQKRENDLVGATFGRGFFILDDYSPLRHVSDEVLNREAELFPVRDALWYVQREVLGNERKANQGDAFYVAPNPPFGAVFTYYLKEDIQTREDARREVEEKRAKTGGDNPSPSWEVLLDEEFEEKPSVVLTVLDESGAVVRRVQGPVKAGFHRVAWDLRRPVMDAVNGTPREPWQSAPKGVLAPPGGYTVKLAIRKDGVLRDTGLEQTFNVVPMRMNALATRTPEQVGASLSEIAALERDVDASIATIADALNKVGKIKTALMSSTADARLHDEARRIERRLKELQQQVSGNTNRNLYNDDHPVPLNERLQAVQRGVSSSTYGPTAQHERIFDLAREELAGVTRALERIVDADLPALERDLDAAGVPWTPGRSVGSR